MLLYYYTPAPRRGRGYTILRLSVPPSDQDIFHRIFLSNWWWQKSDIWSQASYRYPISWEAFFYLSDSYFLFVEERGYHRWTLAHSSPCYSISRIDWFLVLNATFSNISAISWRPVLVMEEVGENHRPWANNW